jgi:ferrous iron transport protein A
LVDINFIIFFKLLDDLRLKRQIALQIKVGGRREAENQRDARQAKPDVRARIDPGGVVRGRNTDWKLQMKLSEVKQGQSAVIEQVGGSGALRRRILEMGMIKGARVYVEKFAPLKDPMELIIKGTHVSLRVEEAAQIHISDIR